MRDNYTKCKLIAEIGCNHMGDFELAKKFIEVAANFCKVDVVKFQKRNPKELMSKSQYKKPHPNPKNSFGSTYGSHREFLEFDISQHKQLKELCEEHKILYCCSVWDLTSAIEIANLKPKMIKIPSAINTNFKVLGWLCENYEGEIHLSLGMTTRKEEADIISFFTEKKRNKDLVLYSCTSAYPVVFGDICLMEIERLRGCYGNHIKSVGFSGHHNGIAVDIGAYVIGANYIERHFTLDKTWKGTDHMASLEPEFMRRLKIDLDVVHMSLTYKKQEILDVEKSQREKLKCWSDAESQQQT